MDDSFRQDVLAGAQKDFSSAQFSALLVQKFDRNKPDFSKIAPALAQSGAQAVIFIGASASVVEGSKALRAAGGDAQVLTLSNNASSGFIKSLSEVARSVILTQVFPNSLNFGLVKEAHELARVKGLDETTWASRVPLH